MDINMASCLAQNALTRVDEWYREVGLSVNPDKTEMIIFTRKRKLEGWKDLYTQGRRVEGEQVVRHLGVTLDAKLK